jgi:hypothetical protein
MCGALGELAQTSGVAAGLEMKPLPVLTEEDWSIWLRLRAGQFDSSNDDSWLEIVDHYEASDRRDAELMLRAQEVAQFGPAAIELYGIACRGRNSPPYWIEDTADGEGIWQR